MVTVWGVNSWVDFDLPTPLDLNFSDFECRNRLRFACSIPAGFWDATSKFGDFFSPKLRFGGVGRSPSIQEFNPYTVTVFPNLFSSQNIKILIRKSLVQHYVPTPPIWQVSQDPPSYSNNFFKS